MSLTRIITASVGLALVVAALAGVLAYTHLSLESRARYWVVHTHRAIEQNQTLFSLLQDAETGQRGYLLSEDPAYLAPFDRAEPRIAEAQAGLAALVADSPVQSGRVRDLNRLVSRRLAIVERSVALGRSGDFAAARAMVTGGQGLRLMTDIRRRVGVISKVEEALLGRRIQSASGADRLNLAIGLAVAIVALVGLLGSSSVFPAPIAA
ncbi:MAG: CHASE3 domain-containing protein [Caulobacteraceae bacterium]|nr:CHASE3 domain-containing protein [Caulobacteraceae bacterium]